MRRFHSYGPVDCQEHFCVERKELVERCINQLLEKYPDAPSITSSTNYLCYYL